LDLSAGFCLGGWVWEGGIGWLLVAATFLILSALRSS